MFAVSIAALFSGVHQDVGPIKVQLADVLAIVTIGVLVLRKFSAPHASRVLSILLTAYMLVFLISAFFVNGANGVKELIQASLIVSFLFVTFGYYGNHNAMRLFAIVVPLLVLIMAYNIGWHVMHGKIVGWKELNEPKTIFILLPLLLLMAASRFPSRRAKYVVSMLSILAAVVIFLSGERKGYMFGAAALVIWNGAAILRYALPVAIIAIPIGLMGAGLTQNNYLNRQIASLSAALSGEDVDSVSATTLFDERRPLTMSDAQRQYTLRTAHELWRQKPLLGIGTNAFTDISRSNLSIPEEFRVGIHGEFYRSLYENGLIGLFLYLSIWVVAFVHVLLTWKATNALGDPYLNRLKLATLTMLVIYCSVEANKGLTIICICALPFIVAWRPKPLREPLL